MAKTFLVLTLPFLLLAASCRINSGVKPPLPSDAALSELFFKHRSDLDKLLVMLKEDLKTFGGNTNNYVISLNKKCLEAGNCSKELPETRQREYQEALATLPDLKTA